MDGTQEKLIPLWKRMESEKIVSGMSVKGRVESGRSFWRDVNGKRVVILPGKDEPIEERRGTGRMTTGASVESEKKAREAENALE